MIGSAIGLELVRSGRRTLNIDRLPAAEYGPTSNSCAIIRVHYSTLEGTALAYDGFYKAIDTSWNQFKNAPCAGRMMAQLIDYCEKGGDHDARPFEYDLKYVDRTINTGTFSRKRDVNPNSSFSVLG